MKYIKVLCVKSMVNVSQYLALLALVDVTGPFMSEWISFRLFMALCGAW